MADNNNAWMGSNPQFIIQLHTGQIDDETFNTYDELHRDLSANPEKLSRCRAAGFSVNQMTAYGDVIEIDRFDAC
jgi:hypothetical protein